VVAIYPRNSKAMSVPYVSPCIFVVCPVRFDGSQQARQPHSSPPPLIYVPPDSSFDPSSDPRQKLSSPLDLHPKQKLLPSSFVQNFNASQQQYTTAGQEKTLTESNCFTDDDTVSIRIADCVEQFQHQDSSTRSAAISSVVKEKGNHPVNCKSRVSSGLKSMKQNGKTNKKRYQCDICRRRYLQLSELVAHKKIHKERQFQCVLCQKKFTRHCNLVTHMNEVYHAVQ